MKGNRLKLMDIGYSDTTPDVTFTYDRLGRMASATSSASTRTLAYTGFALTKEIQDNYIIERFYDSMGRATGYELYSPDDLINPVQTIIYGYSDNGQFHSVASVNSGVTNQCIYSYLSGSDLISGYVIATPSTGSTNLTVNRSYEADRNLITAISNSWNSAIISSFDYSNNALGRRTKRADYFNASIINNDFTYNIFGEVIEAAMGNNIYINDYDPIGNRSQCTIDNGQLITTNVYSANQLNQYTSISGGMSVNLSHDDDGNMTFNGEWDYVWDAENRMISATERAQTNGASKVEFGYDHLNRRVCRTVQELSGVIYGYPPPPQTGLVWNVTKDIKYVWDDWNLIAELTSTNTSSFITHNSSFYAWGLDLSGTLQGAGGVGGLLSETKFISSNTSTFYALADANGNITEYVDSTGAIKAHYEYSVKGEEVYSSDTMKDDFKHRFSSKPFDKKTKIVKYEERDYLPAFGCWASRDRIGVNGGTLKENGFLNNDSINNWDLLGESCSAKLKFRIFFEGKYFRMYVDNNPLYLDYEKFKQLSESISSKPITDNDIGFTQRINNDVDNITAFGKFWNWSQSNCSGNMLSIEIKNKATPYYVTRIVSVLKPKDYSYPVSKTIERHEQTHLNYYLQFWQLYTAEVGRFVNKCVCSDCKEPIDNYLKYKYWIMDEGTAIFNSNLDVKDYKAPSMEDIHTSLAQRYIKQANKIRSDHPKCFKNLN